MIISNLGAVNRIEINFKDLMVFTGSNNTGKTHTSYLIYGILSSLFDNNSFSILYKELLNGLFTETVDTNLNITININKKDLEDEFIDKSLIFLNDNLKDIALKNFKINKKNFEKLNLEISKNEIKEICGNFTNIDNKKFFRNGIEFNMINNIDTISINAQIIDISQYNKVKNDNDFKSILINFLSRNLINLPNVIYFPAERNGINVFKNELNERRLKTYDTLLNTIHFTNLKNAKEKDKLREQLFFKNIELLMEDVSNSSYPKPISDYILFLNNMKNGYKDNNLNKISDYIRNEILKGKFELNEKDSSVSFKQKYGRNKYRSESIPFHVVSSSIKSLYGFDYYIDNIAKPGDYLIIDEPELSLHPENQVKLARVISELIMSGIKIITSTHSDILIRELTNIILEYELKDSSLFNNSKVSVYNFRNQQIIKELDKLTSIKYFDNFDETIFEIQKRYNDLLEEFEDNYEIENESK